MAQAFAREMRLPPLPAVRDLLRLYKIRAVKRLSQNFLLDPRIIGRIVKVSGNLNGAHVCEVGPGPGGITRALLSAGVEKLLVIEKDARFLPTLELLQEAASGHMQIIMGDVLSYNMENAFPEVLKKAWEDESPTIHLIGNLPFSVSTPLIIRWMKSVSARNSAWTYGRVPMTLTFQKEVAERICAPISSPQRCRLSVMCQYLCDVKHKFSIQGGSFIPAPKVDAGVVHFTPRKSPVINLPFALIEKVVRCTFHMRQKECHHGFATLIPPALQQSLIPKVFAIAEVDPKTRPFQLTLDEFDRLCHVYNLLVEKVPEIGAYEYRAPRKERISGEDLRPQLEKLFFF